MKRIFFAALVLLSAALAMKVQRGPGWTTDEGPYAGWNGQGTSNNEFR